MNTVRVQRSEKWLSAPPVLTTMALSVAVLVLAAVVLPSNAREGAPLATALPPQPLLRAPDAATAPASATPTIHRADVGPRVVDIPRVERAAMVRDTSGAVQHRRAEVEGRHREPEHADTRRETRHVARDKDRDGGRHGHDRDDGGHYDTGHRERHGNDGDGGHESHGGEHASHEGGHDSHESHGDGGGRHGR